MTTKKKLSTYTKFCMTITVCVRVCVCVCMCVCAHSHTHTHKHILTKHTLVCHETINFAEKQTRTKHLMKLYVEEDKNYVTYVK